MSLKRSAIAHLYPEMNHFHAVGSGGGGGGAFTPHFGRYVPSVKMGVSGTGFAGCVWQALWPAANLGALPEIFEFGLAAVSRPWAAMKVLNVKKF